MLSSPDFISSVCRKNCQFIIGGSGIFIRKKNLSELVRLISVGLLGFPEIPRIQREDDTQTTKKHAQDRLAHAKGGFCSSDVVEERCSIAGVQNPNGVIL